MRSRLPSLVISTFVLFAGLTAYAQTFTFETLAIPGATTTNAVGFGPGGEVLGYDLDHKKINGFIEKKGHFDTVNVKGAFSTLLTDANATTIVGQTLSLLGVTTGFSLDASGDVTTLAYPGAVSTYPTAINTSGVIVGYYDPPSGNAEEEGFVLRNGKYTNVYIPNTFDTEVSDINTSGTIVGSYRLQNSSAFVGYVYSKGKLTTIAYPGAYETNVQGINDAGEIVGYYSTAPNAGYIGFVLNGDTYTSFTAPESDSTYAYKINNAGQVVGFVIQTDGKEVGFVGTPTDVSRQPGISPIQ